MRGTAFVLRRSGGGGGGAPPVRSGRSAWLHAIPSHRQYDSGISKRRVQDYRNASRSKNPLQASIKANFTFSNMKGWQKRTTLRGHVAPRDAVLMAHDANETLTTPVGGDDPQSLKRFRSSGVGGGIFTAAATSCDSEALKAAIFFELLPVAQAWDMEDGCCPNIAMPAALARFSLHAHRRRSEGESPQHSADPCVASASCGVGAVSTFCHRAATVSHLRAEGPRWKQHHREGREDSGRVLSFFTRAEGGFKSTHLLGMGARLAHMMFRCLSSVDVWPVSPGLAPAMIVAMAEHFYHYEPVAQLEICRMLLALDHHHHRWGDISSSTTTATTANIATGQNCGDAVAMVAPHIVPKLWASLPKTFRFLSKRMYLLDCVEVVCLSWRLGGSRVMVAPNGSGGGGAAAAYMFLRHELGLGTNRPPPAAITTDAAHRQQQAAPDGWHCFDTAMHTLYAAASAPCHNVRKGSGPTSPSSSGDGAPDVGAARSVVVAVVDDAVASLWEVLASAIEDTAVVTSSALVRYLNRVDEALRAAPPHRAKKNVSVQDAPAGGPMVVPASLVRGTEALSWGAEYLDAWWHYRHHHHNHNAVPQQEERGSLSSSLGVSPQTSSTTSANATPAAHRSLLARLEGDLEEVKAAMGHLLFVAAPSVQRRRASGVDAEVQPIQRKPLIKEQQLAPTTPVTDQQNSLEVHRLLGGRASSGGDCIAHLGEQDIMSAYLVPIRRWVGAAERFVAAARRLEASLPMMVVDAPDAFPRGAASSLHEAREHWERSDRAALGGQRTSATSPTAARVTLGMSPQMPIDDACDDFV